jgi:hypothetical protein
MKLFKKKNANPNFSRKQALMLRPVKNVQVTETRLENGTIMLCYPVRTSPWVESLIRRFSKTPQKQILKKVQLDILGSAVWELMDGNRPVKQIAEEFARQFQLHPKEAEVSVTQFIRMLGKRGMIGLG